MIKLTKFVVQESSITGEIRRTVSLWAKELNFDETLSGKLSIVVTELSSNIIKHAGNGEIIALLSECSIEIVAIDKGPGMANPNKCFEDGFSTQGTQGTGLGAIRRLSHHFDLYTQEGKGTVVYAQFMKPDVTIPKYDVAGLSVAYKDEPVCGDGWWVREDGSSLKVLISDGLGHGLLAHDASIAAIEAFKLSPHHSPFDDINRLHNALRSTRGAAVAVAYVDFEHLKVNYAGLGNIASSIHENLSVKRLISYNGITGVQMRKVQPMTYPMNERSVFVLSSDGLSTHWNLGDYPGLQFKSAHVIAGVLYRDHGRTSDDVTVVVIKERE